MNVLSRFWSPSLRSLLATSVFFCAVGAAAAASSAADSAEEPPVKDGSNAPTVAADDAASEHTPSYASLKERENQARQRLAEALSTLRTQSQAWVDLMGGADDHWEAHDALLEGVIRLQRGDRMAWVPPQCEMIGVGALQFVDFRGVNRSGTASAQLESTQIVNLASHCDTTALGETAMRSVGMALPDMREHGTERRLVTALSLYASTSERTAFRRGDIRLMIPFFEALLTVGEAAGLERTLQGVRSGNPDVGLELIARYEMLARTAPMASLRVNPPEDCTATVAGARVRGREVKLRSGSHSVGCEGGAQHRFHYSSSSTELFPVQDP